MAIIIVIALLASYAVALFNRFVKLRSALQEALSGIDVQLKRRHELVPNLVNVVKHYAAYERDLLEDVTALRAQANTTGPLGRVATESSLSLGLRGLLALAEAYPDLKADKHYLSLQESLIRLEDELQMARRYYNGSVRELNTAVCSFPGNLVAAAFGVRPEKFFELESAFERAVPGIHLSAHRGQGGTAAVCVIAALFVASGAGFSKAEERILAFHSDIAVRIDGSMQVTETIRVLAEGKRIRHGIYRDFPMSYKTASGRRMLVDFKVLKVMRDGQPEEYHQKKQANGLRTYLGSKEEIVPVGEHEYAITYVTDRQTGSFEEYDELYWNVTGNGWDFAMSQVSAVVVLPSRAQQRVLQTAFYTGLEGERGKDAETGMDAQNRITFRTTRPLLAHEGLTIAVSWPKGIVLGPTPQQRLMYFLRDWRGFLAGGTGLVILLLFYLVSWNRVGRDPGKGVIIPLFYPPKDLSPAGLRYLMNMGYDNQVAACALISMAVKGYLTISEEADGTSVLAKTGKAEDVLFSEEKVLAAEFFRGGGRLELLQRNHAVLASGISRLQGALARSQEKNYFVTNRGVFGVGLCLSFAVIAVTVLTDAKSPPVVLFMCLWLSIWTLGVAALGAALLQAWKSVSRNPVHLPGALFLSVFSLPFFGGEIFGILTLVAFSSPIVLLVLLMAIGLDVLFYYLLRAPTFQGRRIMDQVEGFRMYLSVAEKDRLQMLGRPQESVELFEQYLPYALALGVEQVWAEGFSGVLARASAGEGAYRPHWYSGSLLTTAGGVGFASGLGSALSTTIGSASSAPSSRSGSGGGGSSGGGGGGGGGGGW